MKKIIILFLTTSFLISCGSSANTGKNNSAKKDTGSEIAKLKFGLEVMDVNASHKGQTDLSHGVVVKTVYPGLSANAAGIQKEDIIVTLGKHNVLNKANFNNVLNKYYKYEYGQIKMTVVRNNELIKVVLYLR